VPRDERPEAAIEKRSADGLDVGEVKAHAAGGFQRFGDLVVDLLRVGTRTHPTTMIAQLNDLHECATRWRFRSGVSRGPGGSLEEAKAFRHDKANDEQRHHTPVTFSCVHIPAFALHAAIEHSRDICGHPLPTT